MIEPELSNQVEYVPFSVTFTVSAVPLDPPDPLQEQPTIESVSVTASDGKDYSSDLTITITSPTTVTISGELSDVFNRTMSYLDENDTIGMVSRFKDIPANFNSLFKYTGATVNSVDLSVNVVTDQGTEVATIEVRNNWEVANAKLKEYVAKGKF